MESLASDARGDDVAVVSARTGGERIGALDSCFDQCRAVEDLSGQPATLDALELLEDVGIAVHHGNRVALRLEFVREIPADSAVPPDDHVHVTCSLVRCCFLGRGLAVPADSIAPS